MSVVRKITMIFFTCLTLSSFADEVDDDANKIDEPDAHPTFYRTPEEKREAGLGTELTDWLVVSGLLEIEREQPRYELMNGSILRESVFTTKALQIGLDFSFSDNFEAEMVFEIEDEGKTRMKVDEAVIAWDWQDFGFTFGRYAPSFGEYYSHLVVSPMLEFGETRATTFTIDYSVKENLELSLFWLKSDVNSHAKSKNIDWGMALEWTSEDEAIRFGSSYLSDIAESDEGFFDDANNVYKQRVDAVSAYVFWGLEGYEFSAEMVKTLDQFVEFEHHINQPEAYNFEFAYFPMQELQIAFRYEMSRELEDMPEKRYGLGMRWLLFDNINIAADYLVGRYKAVEFADEDEELFKNDTTLAIQISIEF